MNNNNNLLSIINQKLIKMKITYPHVIENCIGEKIIFKELIKEPDGDRLLGENLCYTR